MEHHTKIPHVLAVLKNTPWAMAPEKLEEILEVIRLKVAGVDVPYEAAEKPTEQRRQGVAVLPLFGMITQRANMFTKISGATALEDFMGQFRALRQDPEIGALVLNIASPGGAVFGVPEAAAEIYNSRGVKPIIAVANPTAASAAYWIGSAANEFFVTPSGLAGSIGVFGVFEDRSGLEGKDGVTHRIFRAGKFKAEGNPYEPLTDEAAAHLQNEVDRYYDMFVSSVAKNRGAKVAQVRGGYGEGRSIGAHQAVEAGLADGVATLDEVVAHYAHSLAGGKPWRMLRMEDKEKVTIDDIARWYNVPLHLLDDLENPSPPPNGPSDEELRRRLKMA